VILCRPRDPEAKGLVERANEYLQTSFLPGRSFSGPGDFNAQLGVWLARANRRHHRPLRCRPVERWKADRVAMVALPPVAPILGWTTSLRLPRDHYVRLDGNDYSVDPAAVGRRIVVTADLEQVVVTLDGQRVARHVRWWARHQSITDPTRPDPTRPMPRPRPGCARPTRRPERRPDQRSPTGPRGCSPAS
jgi:transposase